jgi:ankyrin repeat protein
MSLEADYLGAFEEHSPEGIRDALAAGASATALIKGKTPVDCLIEGYLRSPQFGVCLRVLLDAGASIDDPLLEAILLDDRTALQGLLNIPGQDLNRKLHVPCAFTSCEGVSALHLCAEFNSVACAQVLIKAGATVNAVADVDAEGFGGQTPIFHAVNSIFNYCRPTLELLVDGGADLDVRLKGLLWGIGADWETLLLDVTPISYAQCGLYAQFHRREQDVYSNLSYLYKKRSGSALRVRNVPNKYLAPKQ